ncbi:hypothetical protein XENOCAPTIV_019051 [Xenoophorus captivus]|uniref:Uncharacterized protein n=1 Tax=Xenoophorus captivus TaxID=1517983 RepID=A0ABV0QSM0_9TELE
MSLKLFCEQMLHVCGPDRPSEAKTASHFTFNQNIGLQAIAQEGKAVSKVVHAPPPSVRTRGSFSVLRLQRAQLDNCVARRNLERMQLRNWPININKKKVR